MWHAAPGIGFAELNMSPSIYFIDREQNTTLQDIGAYDGDSLDVTGSGKPEHVPGLDVTDGTLPILGVAPVLGRLFNRKDDSPGAPQTVVLSYGYWQRKFGGASSVIGRSITVDGKPQRNHRRPAAGDFTFSINRMSRCSCLSNGTAIKPRSATSVSAPLPA